MSDSNSSQPNTLDEALQEIESLRSQLSGSDLKVFSQNRELRGQNTEFKEQIRSLTEQAVSQSFSIRGLEKSEAKLKDELAASQTRVAELEGNVSALQTEVAGLKDQISELETQVTDLGGQLETHRTRELNLSQELEATVAKNQETVAQMVSEQEELARVRAAEMEEANKRFEAEVAAREDARLKFEEQVRNKENAIKALEERVEQFKEEFLSQEFAPAELPTPSLDDTSGKAYDLLCRKMESLLGFPGKSLVEQVFRLSGVSQESSNVAELEETFEVLQDTASQLVKSPEQEKELALLLESAWTELGLGSRSATVTEQTERSEPEVAPEQEVQEPEPSESVEESSSQEPEVEAVEPEAELESAVTDEEPDTDESAPESLEQTSSDESPSQEPEQSEEIAEASVEQEAAVEETAESVDQSEVSESVEAEEEVAVETELAPEVEAAEEIESAENEVETQSDSDELEQATEEEAVAETEAEEEVVAEAEEEVLAEETPSATEDLEEDAPAADPSPESIESNEPSDGVPDAGDAESAFRLLEEGQNSEALAVFSRLAEAEPDTLSYQIGKMSALTGLGRFQEAYTAGKTLEGLALGEYETTYNDNFVTALMGLSSEADNDLARKQYILELALRPQSGDQLQTFLDEADEIGLRIPREGELSLIQAKHRISQDDVTDYLLEALHSLSDRNEVFSLMKTNLERYPELQPLSDFMDSLLESPRAEALEAEESVTELLGQGEAIEEQLDEVDPGEEALVQVFLEHLIPRSQVDSEVPCEEFEEWLLDAEPAAFVGSLRQALRSVDYTIFFDEIEVLSYDGEDRFLLRSSPEPTPTLLFGAELDDVPPEELRFLVLRELFSMYRKHSQLAHISAGLDDSRRAKLVKACVEIFDELESKVTDEVKLELDEILRSATDAGQDSEFRAALEAFLERIYRETESDSFIDLGDFLYGGQLNKKWLDSIADGFAARQTGLVVASYAICRDQMSEDDFEQLEEEGFKWLYSEDNLSKFHELRLRLQRLWTTPLKALISDTEE